MKFTLTELIDHHSDIFPVKVRVVKGFYDEKRGEGSAIAVDELYDFHFVKRSKVSCVYNYMRKRGHVSHV